VRLCSLSLVRQDKVNSKMRRIEAGPEKPEENQKNNQFVCKQNKITNK
jgi:hypothetical protein